MADLARPNVRPEGWEALGGAGRPEREADPVATDRPTRQPGATDADGCAGRPASRGKRGCSTGHLRLLSKLAGPPVHRSRLVDSPCPRIQSPVEGAAQSFIEGNSGLVSQLAPCPGNFRAGVAHVTEARRTVLRQKIGPKQAIKGGDQVEDGDALAGSDVVRSAGDPGTSAAFKSAATTSAT